MADFGQHLPDASAGATSRTREAIKVAKATSGTLRLVHVIDEFVMGDVENPAFYSAALVDALRAVGRKVLEDSEDAVEFAASCWAVTLSWFCALHQFLFCWCVENRNARELRPRMAATTR